MASNLTERYGIIFDAAVEVSDVTLQPGAEAFSSLEGQLDNSPAAQKLMSEARAFGESLANQMRAGLEQAGIFNADMLGEGLTKEVRERLLGELDEAFENVAKDARRRSIPIDAELTERAQTAFTALKVIAEQQAQVIKIDVQGLDEIAKAQTALSALMNLEIDAAKVNFTGLVDAATEAGARAAKAAAESFKKNFNRALKSQRFSIAVDAELRNLKQTRTPKVQVDAEPTQASARTHRRERRPEPAPTYVSTRETTTRRIGGAARQQPQSPYMLAFDLESTGLDQGRDRIVTYAAVPVDRTTGKLAENARTVGRTGLINAGKAIPAAATRVHGITNERMQREGRAPRAELLKLAEALNWAKQTNTPVVGHNIAGFDLGLAKAEFRRHNIPFDWEGLTYIDTVAAARNEAKREGVHGRSNALEQVAARKGVPTWSAHEALGDALGSAQVAAAYLRSSPQDVRVQRPAWTSQTRSDLKRPERPLRRSVQTAARQAAQHAVRQTQAAQPRTTAPQRAPARSSAARVQPTRPTFTRVGDTLERADLAQLTRDELYRMAQERDIPGRSKMNKAALLASLTSSRPLQPGVGVRIPQTVEVGAQAYQRTDRAAQGDPSEYYRIASMAVIPREQAEAELFERYGGDANAALAGIKKQTHYDEWLQYRENQARIAEAQGKRPDASQTLGLARWQGFQAHARQKMIQGVPVAYDGEGFDAKRKPGFVYQGENQAMYPIDPFMESLRLPTYTDEHGVRHYVTDIEERKLAKRLMKQDHREQLTVANLPFVEQHLPATDYDQAGERVQVGRVAFVDESLLYDGAALINKDLRLQRKVARRVNVDPNSPTVTPLLKAGDVIQPGVAAQLAKNSPAHAEFTRVPYRVTDVQHHRYETDTGVEEYYEFLFEGIGSPGQFRSETKGGPAKALNIETDMSDMRFFDAQGRPLASPDQVIALDSLASIATQHYGAMDAAGQADLIRRYAPADVRERLLSMHAQRTLTTNEAMGYLIDTAYRDLKHGPFKDAASFTVRERRPMLPEHAAAAVRRHLGPAAEGLSDADLIERGLNLTHFSGDKMLTPRPLTPQGEQLYDVRETAGALYLDRFPVTLQEAHDGKRTRLTRETWESLREANPQFADELWWRGQAGREALGSVASSAIYFSGKFQPEEGSYFELTPQMLSDLHTNTDKHLRQYYEGYLGESMPVDMQDIPFHVQQYAMLRGLGDTLPEELLQRNILASLGPDGKKVLLPSIEALTRQADLTQGGPNLNHNVTSLLNRSLKVIRGVETGLFGDPDDLYASLQDAVLEQAAGKEFRKNLTGTEVGKRDMRTSQLTIGENLRPYEAYVPGMGGSMGTVFRHPAMFDEGNTQVVFLPREEAEARGIDTSRMVLPPALAQALAGDQDGDLANAIRQNRIYRNQELNRYEVRRYQDPNDPRSAYEVVQTYSPERMSAAVQKMAKRRIDEGAGNLAEDRANVTPVRNPQEAADLVSAMVTERLDRAKGVTQEEAVAVMHAREDLQGKIGPTHLHTSRYARGFGFTNEIDALFFDKVHHRAFGTAQRPDVQDPQMQRILNVLGANGGRFYDQTTSRMAVQAGQQQLLEAMTMLQYANSDEFTYTPTEIAQTLGTRPEQQANIRKAVQAHRAGEITNEQLRRTLYSGEFRNDAQAAAGEWARTRRVGEVTLAMSMERQVRKDMELDPNLARRDAVRNVIKKMSSAGFWRADEADSVTDDLYNFMEQRDNMRAVFGEISGTDEERLEQVVNYLRAMEELGLAPEVRGRIQPKDPVSAGYSRAEAVTPETVETAESAAEKVEEAKRRAAEAGAPPMPDPADVGDAELPADGSGKWHSVLSAFVVGLEQANNELLELISNLNVVNQHLGGGGGGDGGGPGSPPGSPPDDPNVPFVSRGAGKQAGDARANQRALRDEALLGGWEEFTDIAKRRGLNEVDFMRVLDQGYGERFLQQYGQQTIRDLVDNDDFAAMLNEGNLQGAVMRARSDRTSMDRLSRFQDYVRARDAGRPYNFHSNDPIRNDEQRLYNDRIMRMLGDEGMEQVRAGGVAGAKALANAEGRARFTTERIKLLQNAVSNSAAFLISQTAFTAFAAASQQVGEYEMASHQVRAAINMNRGSASHPGTMAALRRASTASGLGKAQVAGILSSYGSSRPGDVNVREALRQVRRMGGVLRATGESPDAMAAFLQTASELDIRDPNALARYAVSRGVTLQASAQALQQLAPALEGMSQRDIARAVVGAAYQRNFTLATGAAREEQVRRLVQEGGSISPFARASQGMTQFQKTSAALKNTIDEVWKAIRPLALVLAKIAELGLKAVSAVAGFINRLGPIGDLAVILAGVGAGFIAVRSVMKTLDGWEFFKELTVSIKESVKELLVLLGVLEKTEEATKKTTEAAKEATEAATEQKEAEAETESAPDAKPDAPQEEPQEETKKPEADKKESSDATPKADDDEAEAADPAAAAEEEEGEGVAEQVKEKTKSLLQSLADGVGEGILDFDERVAEHGWGPVLKDLVGRVLENFGGALGNLAEAGLKRFGVPGAAMAGNVIRGGRQAWAGASARATGTAVAGSAAGSLTGAIGGIAGSAIRAVLPMLLNPLVLGTVIGGAALFGTVRHVRRTNQARQDYRGFRDDFAGPGYDDLVAAYAGELTPEMEKLGYTAEDVKRKIDNMHTNGAAGARIFAKNIKQAAEEYKHYVGLTDVLQTTTQAATRRYDNMARSAGRIAVAGTPERMERLQERYGEFFATSPSSYLDAVYELQESELSARNLRWQTLLTRGGYAVQAGWDTFTDDFLGFDGQLLDPDVGFRQRLAGYYAQDGMVSAYMQQRDWIDSKSADVELASRQIMSEYMLNTGLSVKQVNRLFEQDEALQRNRLRASGATDSGVAWADWLERLDGRINLWVADVLGIRGTQDAAMEMAYIDTRRMPKAQYNALISELALEEGMAQIHGQYLNQYIKGDIGGMVTHTDRWRAENEFRIKNGTEYQKYIEARAQLIQNQLDLFEQMDAQNILDAETRSYFAGSGTNLDNNRDFLRVLSAPQAAALLGSNSLRHGADLRAAQARREAILQNMERARSNLGTFFDIGDMDDRSILEQGLLTPLAHVDMHEAETALEKFRQGLVANTKELSNLETQIRQLNINELFRGAFAQSTLGGYNLIEAMMGRNFGYGHDRAFSDAASNLIDQGAFDDASRAALSAALDSGLLTGADQLITDTRNAIQPTLLNVERNVIDPVTGEAQLRASVQSLVTHPKFASAMQELSVITGTQITPDALTEFVIGQLGINNLVDSWNYRSSAASADNQLRAGQARLGHTTQRWDPLGAGEERTPYNWEVGGARVDFMMAQQQAQASYANAMSSLALQYATVDSDGRRNIVARNIGGYEYFVPTQTSGDGVYEALAQSLGLDMSIAELMAQQQLAQRTSAAYIREVETATRRSLNMNVLNENRLAVEAASIRTMLGDSRITPEDRITLEQRLVDLELEAERFREITQPRALADARRQRREFVGSLVGTEYHDLGRHLKDMGSSWMYDPNLSQEFRDEVSLLDRPRHLTDGGVSYFREGSRFAQLEDVFRALGPGMGQQMSRFTLDQAQIALSTLDLSGWARHVTQDDVTSIEDEIRRQALELAHTDIFAAYGDEAVARATAYVMEQTPLGTQLQTRRDQLIAAQRAGMSLQGTNLELANLLGSGFGSVQHQDRLVALQQERFSYAEIFGEESQQVRDLDDNIELYSKVAGDLDEVTGILERAAHEAGMLEGYAAFEVQAQAVEDAKTLLEAAEARSGIEGLVERQLGAQMASIAQQTRAYEKQGEILLRNRNLMIAGDALLAREAGIDRGLTTLNEAASAQANIALERQLLEISGQREEAKFEFRESLKDLNPQTIRAMAVQHGIDLVQNGEPLSEEELQEQLIAAENASIDARAALATQIARADHAAAAAGRFGELARGGLGRHETMASRITALRANFASSSEDDQAVLADLLAQFDGTDVASIDAAIAEMRAGVERGDIISMDQIRALSDMAWSQSPAVRNLLDPIIQEAMGSQRINDMLRTRGLTVQGDALMRQQAGVSRNLTSLSQAEVATARISMQQRELELSGQRADALAQFDQMLVDASPASVAAMLSQYGVDLHEVQDETERRDLLRSLETRAIGDRFDTAARIARNEFESASANRFMELISSGLGRYETLGSRLESIQASYDDASAEDQETLASALERFTSVDSKAVDAALATVREQMDASDVASIEAVAALAAASRELDPEAQALVEPVIAAAMAERARMRQAENIGRPQFSRQQRLDALNEEVAELAALFENTELEEITRLAGTGNEHAMNYLQMLEDRRKLEGEIAVEARLLSQVRRSQEVLRRADRDGGLEDRLAARQTTAELYGQLLEQELAGSNYEGMSASALLLESIINPELFDETFQENAENVRNLLNEMDSMGASIKSLTREIQLANEQFAVRQQQENARNVGRSDASAAELDAANAQTLGVMRGQFERLFRPELFDDPNFSMEALLDRARLGDGSIVNLLNNPQDLELAQQRAQAYRDEQSQRARQFAARSFYEQNLQNAQSFMSTDFSVEAMDALMEASNATFAQTIVDTANRMGVGFFTDLGGVREALGQDETIKGLLDTLDAGGPGIQGVLQMLRLANTGATNQATFAAASGDITGALAALAPQRAWSTGIINRLLQQRNLPTMGEDETLQQLLVRLQASGQSDLAAILSPIAGQESSLVQRDAQMRIDAINRRFQAGGPLFRNAYSMLGYEQQQLQANNAFLEAGGYLEETSANYSEEMVEVYARNLQRMVEITDERSLYFTGELNALTSELFGMFVQGIGRAISTAITEALMNNRGRLEAELDDQFGRETQFNDAELEYAKQRRDELREMLLDPNAANKDELQKQLDYYVQRIEELETGARRISEQWARQKEDLKTIAETIAEIFQTLMQQILNRGLEKLIDLGFTMVFDAMGLSLGPTSAQQPSVRVPNVPSVPVTQQSTASASVRTQSVDTNLPGSGLESIQLAPQAVTEEAPATNALGIPGDWAAGINAGVMSMAGAATTGDGLGSMATGMGSGILSLALTNPALLAAPATLPIMAGLAAVGAVVGTFMHDAAKRVEAQRNEFVMLTGEISDYGLSRFGKSARLAGSGEVSEPEVSVNATVNVQSLRDFNVQRELGREIETNSRHIAAKKGYLGV